VSPWCFNNVSSSEQLQNNLNNINVLGFYH
jgi:hypothetical protein